MNVEQQVEILTALQSASGAVAKLWEGEKSARLYLTECRGAYIAVDKDGDLQGEGPKLSRAAGARVWGPWEKAARAVGRRLYA